MDVDGLRRAARATVLGPDDDGYEERRLAELANSDHLRPAAIVLARDADDVVATVRFAAEHRVELAVRSGGHSTAGHSSTDGGILLDVRGLDTVDVDLGARTATAGGGVTAGRYTDVVGEHGLATGFGDTGTVGVAGLTLGGGMGLLSRAHGLTVDQLLAADVVTADGALRHVDAEHEPDLFWAIRGGGGNFGVVVSLTFRLHEVPSVVGGMMILPATAAVVRGAVDLGAAAPRELSTIVTVVPAPPMPFLPAEVHGQPIIMLTLAHCGDEADGLAEVARFRDLAQPIADLTGPVPYPALFHAGGPPVRPVAATGTALADEVTDAAIEQSLAWIDGSTAQMTVVQVRPLGAAIADVPDEATAYAHRDAGFAVYVAAMEASVDALEPHAPAIAALSAAFAGTRRGAYVNFLGPAGAEQLREVYPGETWERLVAVKRRYDPGNLFRRNHNVLPA